MEPQPTIEGLQEQLKVVTEDCYQTETAIRKLEQNTGDVQSIFQRVQHLFNEMHEIWREGEMSGQIANLQQETLHQQKRYLHDSEQDYEELKKKKKILRDKEDELYYQKLTLSRKEQTHGN